MRTKLLVLLILVLGSAPAQGPPQRDGINRKNMDAIRVWKLTEVLELTEEQVSTFLPLVQIHERELKQIHKEQIQISKESALLLESGKVSQKDVNKFVKKYSAKQDEIHKIKHDFLKSLPDHLSPEQQLLYLGFETRFRSELRNYMKNERKEMSKKRRDQRQKDKKE